jgi:hypothetical protein
MWKPDLKTSEVNLLKFVVDACQQAIGKALSSPSEAMGIAMGLDSALTTLKLVASEISKGEAGAGHIVEARESLTRGALSNVLALAQDPLAAQAALRAAPPLAPAPASMPAAPAQPVSSAPTFGAVSQAYIDMRIGSDGADHPEIAYLVLRRQTFLEIVGDRPVDQYTHKDLQDYVSAMKCWPGNATKRAEMSGKTIKQILEANTDLHLKPMALKTLKSYVSHIRTMLRHQMNDKHYRDPFADARPRYPGTAAPPRPRQEIPANVLQKNVRTGDRIRADLPGDDAAGGDPHRAPHRAPDLPARLRCPRKGRHHDRRDRRHRAGRWHLASCPLQDRRKRGLLRAARFPSGDRLDRLGHGAGRELVVPAAARL